jgi:hypothetical protein
MKECGQHLRLAIKQEDGNFRREDGRTKLNAFTGARKSKDAKHLLARRLCNYDRFVEAERKSVLWARIPSRWDVRAR